MDPRFFYSPEFNAADLEPFPALPARKRIIWLASYPKSGNTWMRLFLASFLSGKSDVDINADLDENHQCNDPILSQIIAKKQISSFTDLDCARVRVGVQRLYARSESKIFVKTHSAVANPMGHASIDPASTFASVVVLRNPLSVLPSFARHMGIEIDQAIVSMNNSAAVLGEPDKGNATTVLSNWSSFNRSWLASKHQLNAIYVKYEDMRHDPMRAFGDILAHIRIPHDRERIQNAINATDFNKMKSQDMAIGFKERTKANAGAVFFRSGKADGWRRELTEEQVVTTIRNHWDVMEQLDYIPDDYQPEFEDIKFNALEAMVAKGVDIGIYAQDLNALRKKRGIKTQLAVNAAKHTIGRKQASRSQQPKRAKNKKTFG